MTALIHNASIRKKILAYHPVPQEISVFRHHFGPVPHLAEGGQLLCLESESWSLKEIPVVISKG